MSVVLFDACLVIGETICPPRVGRIMREGRGIPHSGMEALALKCGGESGEVTLRFDIMYL